VLVVEGALNEADTHLVRRLLAPVDLDRRLRGIAGFSAELSKWAFMSIFDPFGSAIGVTKS